MTDLRALLYEPWCRGCKTFGHPVGDSCPGDDMAMPLATHLPECVPPGLEKAELPYSHWVLRHQTATGPSDCQPVFGADPITDEQAELLFIGQAVKVLMGEVGCRFYRENDVWWAISNGNQTVKAEPLAELAAALHRLADGRKQETA